MAASSDDAEETPTRSMDLTSSDLELVHDAADQTVGIRFAGLTVPPGATILRAWVQFAADEAQTEPTSLVIRGEAADHAATFTSAAGNVSARPRTTAAVTWATVPGWTTLGEADAAQRTPELAALIQEVVGRPGWAQGNALAIVITGTGHRTAEAFDGERAKAPLLHVEYGM